MLRIKKWFKDYIDTVAREEFNKCIDGLNQQIANYEKNNRYIKSEEFIEDVVTRINNLQLKEIK